MDEITVYPLDDNAPLFEQLHIIELNSQQLGAVESMNNFMRYTMEISQLFEIFRYNFEKLLSTYDLKSSDLIHRNIPQFLDFSDAVEINALLTNYMSAGKTLIDALEPCIKETFPDIQPSDHPFKKYCSEIYDKCFSYRLFEVLRNFTQHGHPAVSISQNKFCFDLVQIIRTPNFNIKKATKKEMEQYIKDVQSSDQICRFAFTYSIAEYTVCISKIYSYFWTTLEPAFEEKRSTFYNVFPAISPLTIHPNPRLNGYLAYLKDNEVHLIGTDDPLIYFSRKEKQAKTFMQSEIHEFEQFKKSFKLVYLDPATSDSTEDSSNT